MTVKKGDLKRQFFIAVFPPDWQIEQFKKMKQEGPSHWEWRREEEFHISLALPGGLTEEEARRLADVLREVHHSAFDISFQGLSYFLREQKGQKPPSHVIWARADAEGDNGLRSLHYRIADAMRRNHFRYGERDITPHMTVGKAPGHELEMAEDFAKARKNAHSPAWKCDRFVLCETLPGEHPDHPARNGGRGSRYRKIEEFILAA